MPALVSIQVALPEEIDADVALAPDGKAWTSAFFKRPVTGPVWLGATNLAGDAQADRKHHGGPDKAVLAYAAAHYPRWRVELAMADLPHGAFAENFTIDGLDERTVCIGDTYRVGAALVQVSQPRQPCWKIAARWQRKDLTAQVRRKGRTGWYLRVLAEGRVQAGDAVELVERPLPEWTVAAAARVMRSRSDYDGAAALAACPLLSADWRTDLAQRAARMARWH